MPYRTTNNIGEKAALIAEKEAEKVWQETGDFGKWLHVLKETYEVVLREFVEKDALDWI